MAEGQIATIANSTGVLDTTLISSWQPDASSPLTKVRQLYLVMYEAITQGRVPDGTRLPASRDLAQRLGVGRNTVIACYEQLAAEQLVVTGGKAGTRVTYSGVSSMQADISCSTSLSLSKRSHKLVSTARAHRALAPGEPDPVLFPQRAWRLALQAAARLPADSLGYQFSPLDRIQQSVARYLLTYRSLRVEPEQIIITSGTRQSLLLSAALYTDPGDVALLETPGYPGAWDAMKQMGLQCDPLLVDSEGAQLPRQTRSDTRLIYLTPCFQYPLGMSLSAQRREAWLALARECGAVIFEDDYDSEFRIDKQPRPALAAAAMGHVLHAGTFSKLLFPAVRVAWLAVPPAHVNAAQGTLRAIGGGHNTIAQTAVAELLDNGTLVKHLQHARQVYGNRRERLVAELQACAWCAEVAGTVGALSLVIKLKDSVPLIAIESALDEQRVGAVPLERFDRAGRKRAGKSCSALVVGLGNVEPLKIPETVARLSQAIKAASVNVQN